MIILKQEYCAEGLNDVEEDISDAIEQIESDEDGFKLGVFMVTVEWLPE